MTRASGRVSTRAVRTELFDYELPADLIARRPLPERDASRLLVVRPPGVEHRTMRELPELIEPNSLLVVNDTRVLRARLLGRRDSGGKAEILLLRRLGEPGREELWDALGRASKPLRPGTRIEAGSLGIEVCSRSDAGSLLVRVSASEPIESALEREGHVPIPPYLEREDDAEDIARYQTVYARRRGSVAAPTAGLHLSERLIQALQTKGVELGALTLHVGIGTFRPVTTETLDEHVMHAERFEISSALREQIEKARREGRRVIAVGTTAVRALESAADPDRPGGVRATAEETALFIRPGYRFQVVDGLLTNFHMPKSTLLALVSAFIGRERLLEAYRAAVAERYRFLSYGDAMWIPRPAVEESRAQ